MAQTIYGKFEKPNDREALLEIFLQQRMEEMALSFAGRSYYPLAGLSGNVTLPVANARSRVLVLTGAPAGAVTLKIDDALGANSDLILHNGCTGSFSTVTVKSTGTNAGNPAGVVLPAALAQLVRQDGDSVYPAAPAMVLTGPLAARVYNSANQSIPTGIPTPLTFNSERRDDGSLHSTSSNTSRLVAQASGWYALSFAGAFAADPTGFRAFNFKVNGTSVIGNPTCQAITTAGEPTGLTLSTLYYLNAGEYAEVFAYHTAAGSLSVLALGNYSPEFAMVRIA